MDNIKNKNALVTGAARGLGYKYAEELLRNGANFVAILDLNTSTGEKSAETLEKEFGKGKAKFFPCDVTKDKDVTDSFQKVVDHCKRLDIVINNAGILNDPQWELTIKINVLGVIRCTLAAMEHMGKHNGGSGGTILNISSIVGLCAVASAPIYTASKHAVLGFSRSLQYSYDRSGVRILVMCPGVTYTNLVSNLDDKLLGCLKRLNVPSSVDELPKQTVDNVANALIQLLQKGKNGAICVSEGGEPPYTVDIPHYSKLAVPLN